MREKDRKLLLKAIAGELGPEEGARLDDRLRADPELRAARERLARVQALVREAPRAPGFGPGFAGRVLAHGLAGPDRVATDLEIMSAEEREQVLRAWNPAPPAAGAATGAVERGAAW